MTYSDSPSIISTCPESGVHQDFQEDVFAGLSQTTKSLPCKYFYDARGSKLFDRICELDEYYPTRTEFSIMENHIEEITEAIGSNCTLIEFGSGSSLKTRILLDHLSAPMTYAPVDISGEHLSETATELSLAYPEFDIAPIVADFTQQFRSNSLIDAPARRVVYFPGSTIGNFTPETSIELLKQMIALAGEEGSLILGIDLKKDLDVLKAAYNDAQGVTAAFNQNLLTRINRELDGDFDLDQFRHEARWNHDQSRIEMHLVSECDQTVTISAENFEFLQGETIHTENSHKYSLEHFRTMCREAGLTIHNHWTDSREWFAIAHCSAD